MSVGPGSIPIRTRFKIVKAGTFQVPIHTTFKMAGVKPSIFIKWDGALVPVAPRVMMNGELFPKITNT